MVYITNTSNSTLVLVDGRYKLTDGATDKISKEDFESAEIKSAVARGWLKLADKQEVAAPVKEEIKFYKGIEEGSETPILVEKKVLTVEASTPVVEELPPTAVAKVGVKKAKPAQVG